jgi:hypothetical protein
MARLFTRTDYGVSDAHPARVKLSWCSGRTRNRQAAIIVRCSSRLLSTATGNNDMQIETNFVIALLESLGWEKGRMNRRQFVAVGSAAGLVAAQG